MQEIWEVRYTDDKYGKETVASFKYFTKWLNEDHPRSIPKFARKIKPGADENQIKRFINTLQTYSVKWKWQMRGEAYDEYLIQLHFKTKERDVMAWESEQLTMALQRSNFHNDTLQKIHDAPEIDEYDKDGNLTKRGIPLNKKVYAESENQSAYNKSVNGVYTILHGGVEKRENKNENTGDMALNANVIGVKPLHERMKENEDTIKGYIAEITTNDATSRGNGTE